MNFKPRDSNTGMANIMFKIISAQQFFVLMQTYWYNKINSLNYLINNIIYVGDDTLAFWKGMSLSNCQFSAKKFADSNVCHNI